MEVLPAAFPWIKLFASERLGGITFTSRQNGPSNVQYVQEYMAIHPCTLVAPYLLITVSQAVSKAFELFSPE